MRLLLGSLLLIVLASCGKDDRGLCEKYFEPYPDLISGRDMPAEHADYTKAMDLYRNADLEGAAQILVEYISLRGYQRSAHLYLANCYLKMDRPFDAELQLDHLENSNVKGFRDQTEWYTLLCWVCSGQLERALPEARRIAAAKHTYSKQAKELVADLDREMK